MVVAPQTIAAESFWVGVIPNERKCPEGVSHVRIKMDDEDNNNKNRYSGYIGAIKSTANTDLYFCRVDGRALYPLAKHPDTASNKHYAVLKLGTTCPNGSVDFSRHFDNEDHNNKNESDGPLGPDNVVSANTTLSFCLFRYGPKTMTDFPQQFPRAKFSFGYGVFAYRSIFPKRLTLDAGHVYIDDEDSKGNKNTLTTKNKDKSIVTDAKRIISGDANTDLRIVKVVDSK